jgi:acetylornithine deacetylase/succinyl-diaminopimelate desuccinylase-like protein
MTSSVGSLVNLDESSLAQLKGVVAEAWDQSIVGTLSEYIRIPNKSPAFDPDWKAHGHMDRAIDLVATWCRARPIPGLTVEVVRLEDRDGRDRTPVILMEIPGQSSDTVLLYGHVDKQPEMVGWGAGLDPWKPVVREDRLYGRGGADDGYAAFASLTAIEALDKVKAPRARCVVLIEACEESGSYDLPAYVEHLQARIGTPSLVVCLDSGCGNYEQLWGTTSLRGLVGGVLTVEVLTEGVHSGDASGIVPTSFRVFRQLLSRLEDEKTGAVIEELHVDIPADRRAQARIVADVLREDLYTRLPFVPGAKPITTDLPELVLNRTWRPSVTVTGMEGFPLIKDAGNVLLPRTSARISVRIPPTLPAETAAARLKEILEVAPPYGARVTFQSEKAGSGWNAPAFQPWLEHAIDQASRSTFGKPAVYYGEGGSIPFMGMLGQKFPQAQFLITGLLGPGSNAHGPNEFLHIPTGKNLTASVALVIAAQHAAARRGATSAS